VSNKTLFIGSVAALLVAFTTVTVTYKRNKARQLAEMAKNNSAPLVRAHSPTLGKADAPVVIVEFIDPACETCSAFYPLVKKILAANPDKVRLVLRYAPFHDGSVKVVAVLEAARRQGKFWPALEALLAAQADWAPHHAARVDLVWNHLGGLGLDLKKMRADMNAPEIHTVIAQDFEDIRALNVTKTPAFFVNGKPLMNFGYEPLKKLVDDELKEQQRW